MLSTIVPSKVPPKAPSTPTNQVSPPAAVIPSPGTWRHPKFDEIARRQNMKTFDDRNLWKIIWNVGALLMTWGPKWTTESFPNLHSLVLPLYRMGDGWPLWLLRMVLLWNIATALMPLARQKDEVTDIALTPSQRALLGLDPNATPPTTPGTQYVTPPRYPRSRTPINGTPASRDSSSANSPRSRNGSPVSGGKQVNDSFFSPSASPLWRGMGGARGERRHSYGLASPLGLPSGSKEMSVFAPSTPSPSGGKAVSVPLNSRWLYERGRSNSGGRSVYS